MADSLDDIQIRQGEAARTAETLRAIQEEAKKARQDTKDLKEEIKDIPKVIEKVNKTKITLGLRDLEKAIQKLEETKEKVEDLQDQIESRKDLKIALGINDKELQALQEYLNELEKIKEELKNQNLDDATFRQQLRKRSKEAKKLTEDRFDVDIDIESYRKLEKELIKLEAQSDRTQRSITDLNNKIAGSKLNSGKEGFFSGFSDSSKIDLGSKLDFDLSGAITNIGKVFEALGKRTTTEGKLLGEQIWFSVGRGLGGASKGSLNLISSYFKAPFKVAINGAKEFGRELAFGIVGGFGFNLQQGLTSAIKNTLGLAFQTNSKFAESIALVNTILPDASTKQDELSNRIFATTNALSNQFNLTETGNAFYQALSSGARDLAEAQKLVQASSALNLAGGGSDSFAGASLEDTQILLASIINSYRTLGLTFDDVNKVADKLFQTTNLGVVTTKQLSTGLGQVLASASGAGVPLEEVLAAVASLTKSGFRAEQAFTAVENIFDRILAPTNEAATQLSRLGLNINSATLASRGLIGVVDELTSKNVGSDAIAEIFGQLAGQGLTSLRTNVDDYQKLLDGINNSNGSVARGAREVANAFPNIFKGFQNSFENFATRVAKFGEGLFKPLLIEGTKFFQQLTDEFNKYGKTYESIARSIGEVLANVFTGTADTIKNILLDTTVGNVVKITGQSNDKARADLEKRLGSSDNKTRTDAFKQVFDAVFNNIKDTLTRIINFFESGYKLFIGVINFIQPAVKLFIFASEQLIKAAGVVVNKLGGGDSFSTSLGKDLSKLVTPNFNSEKFADEFKRLSDNFKNNQDGESLKQAAKLLNENFGIRVQGSTTRFSDSTPEQDVIGPLDLQRLLQNSDTFTESFKNSLTSRGIQNDIKTSFSQGITTLFNDLRTSINNAGDSNKAVNRKGLQIDLKDPISSGNFNFNFNRTRNNPFRETANNRQVNISLGQIDTGEKARQLLVTTISDLAKSGKTLGALNLSLINDKINANGTLLKAYTTELDRASKSYERITIELNKLPDLINNISRTTQSNTGLINEIANVQKSNAFGDIGDLLTGRLPGVNQGLSTFFGAEQNRINSIFDLQRNQRQVTQETSTEFTKTLEISLATQARTITDSLKTLQDVNTKDPAFTELINSLKNGQVINESTLSRVTELLQRDGSTERTTALNSLFGSFNQTAISFAQQQRLNSNFGGFSPDAAIDNQKLTIRNITDQIEQLGILQASPEQIAPFRDALKVANQELIRLLNASQKENLDRQRESIQRQLEVIRVQTQNTQAIVSNTQALLEVAKLLNKTGTDLPGLGLAAAPARVQRSVVPTRQDVEAARDDIARNPRSYTRLTSEVRNILTGFDRARTQAKPLNIDLASNSKLFEALNKIAEININFNKLEQSGVLQAGQQKELRDNLLNINKVGTNNVDFIFKTILDNISKPFDQIKESINNQFASAGNDTKEVVSKFLSSLEVLTKEGKLSELPGLFETLLVASKQYNDIFASIGLDLQNRGSEVDGVVSLITDQLSRYSQTVDQFNDAAYVYAEVERMTGESLQTSVGNTTTALDNFTNELIKVSQSISETSNQLVQTANELNQSAVAYGQGQLANAGSFAGKVGSLSNNSGGGGTLAFGGGGGSPFKGGSVGLGILTPRTSQTKSLSSGNFKNIQPVASAPSRNITPVNIPETRQILQPAIQEVQKISNTLKSETPQLKKEAEKFVENAKEFTQVRFPDPNTPVRQNQQVQPLLDRAAGFLNSYVNPSARENLSLMDNFKRNPNFDPNFAVKNRLILEDSNQLVKGFGFFNRSERSGSNNPSSFRQVLSEDVLGFIKKSQEKGDIIKIDNLDKVLNNLNENVKLLNNRIVVVGDKNNPLQKTFESYQQQGLINQQSRNANQQESQNFIDQLLDRILESTSDPSRLRTNNTNLDDLPELIGAAVGNAVSTNISQTRTQGNNTYNISVNFANPQAKDVDGDTILNVFVDALRQVKSLG